MQFKKTDLNTLDQQLSNMNELLNELERDSTESLNEMLGKLDQESIENTANNAIKQIDLQELADILEISTRIITKNHAGIRINTFVHPKYGEATTLEASGDGALLIQHYL